MFVTLKNNNQIKNENDYRYKNDLTFLLKIHIYVIM